MAAHEDERTVVDVRHPDRAALARLTPAGGPGAARAGGDVGARVERPADALAVAVGGVVGDRDGHPGRAVHRRTAADVSLTSMWRTNAPVTWAVRCGRSQRSHRDSCTGRVTMTISSWRLGS